jgi:dTDP-4-dehydrorhamnose reductase
MIKNIIIGGNGLIARHLLLRTSYIFTTSNKSSNEGIFLDLLHPEDFDYSLLDFNTNIIFLAAISSPDECDIDYEKSYMVNVIGTKYFIKKALEKKTKVLFFSSDVIYGNVTKPVDEHAEVRPFGKYAEMKLSIENEFKYEKKFKIFRLSYVLSKEDKFLKYLKGCVDNNLCAEIFHPFSRKIIYIEDVLDAIENILYKWEDFESQKINICGDESVSRYQIAQLYDKNSKFKLRYSVSDPGKNFWNARPKNINVISRYLHKLLGRQPIKIKNIMKIIMQEGH